MKNEVINDLLKTFDFSKIYFKTQTKRHLLNRPRLRMLFFHGTLKYIIENNLPPSNPFASVSTISVPISWL